MINIALLYPSSKHLSRCDLWVKDRRTIQSKRGIKMLTDAEKKLIVSMMSDWVEDIDADGGHPLVHLGRSIINKLKK